MGSSPFSVVSTIQMTSSNEKVKAVKKMYEQIDVWICVNWGRGTFYMTEGAGAL